LFKEVDKLLLRNDGEASGVESLQPNVLEFFILESEEFKEAFEA